MLFLFLMVIHYVIGYTLPQIENGIELLERRSSTHYQALLIAWIGTSSEDIPVNFKKVFTISQYVDGPSIKVSYIFGKNYTNSIITKHIDVCDNNNESRLLLFDNFNDPYDYYEIPKELYEEDNIHLFKTFLDNRHEITINFTFTADVSLAFLWVHARGNYKLHQLGDNGDKLIINKHNFNIQRTKAGHMFALINDTFSEYNCITETLNAIVAIYIVPAAELKIPQQSITVDLWKESIHCRKTVNCKELILSYWKSQRQSSIPLQSWTVPAVNKKSEKGLFFVEKLPASTFNSLREEYFSQRRSIIDSKESIISTVFNQLEVDTHFYPISNAVIAVIEDIVRKMVSKRWEIPFYNLEITGSYGIREVSINIPSLLFYFI